MAARRILVKGRVQGVGFRFFVARTAERLGVTGEVWNRDDGAVEIMAHHLDEARLAALQESVWTGPGFVRSVEGFSAPDAPREGFRIVRG